jgi:hypothetical protein
VDSVESFTLSSYIWLEASITTGANPSADGIVIMGNSGQCGNLYLWIGSDRTFNFGVQCNGGGSSGALSSSTVAAANTNYDLRCTYDGSTATISVNGVLESSGTKTFNYAQTVTKVAYGAGSIDDSNSEAFDFGVIHSVSLLVEAPTTITREGNIFKAPNAPSSFGIGNHRFSDLQQAMDSYSLAKQFDYYALSTTTPLVETRHHCLDLCTDLDQACDGITYDEPSQHCIVLHGCSSVQHYFTKLAATSCISEFTAQPGSIYTLNDCKQRCVDLDCKYFSRPAGIADTVESSCWTTVSGTTTGNCNEDVYEYEKKGVKRTSTLLMAPKSAMVEWATHSEHTCDAVAGTLTNRGAIGPLKCRLLCTSLIGCQCYAIKSTDGTCHLSLPATNTNPLPLDDPVPKSKNPGFTAYTKEAPTSLTHNVKDNYATDSKDVGKDLFPIIPVTMAPNKLYFPYAFEHVQCKNINNNINSWKACKDANTAMEGQQILSINSVISNQDWP